MNDPIAQMTQAWATRSGVQLWFAEETASTNTVARDDFGAAGKSKLAPVLYLTSRQTHGRGRGTNTWVSSEGALLCSWSFHMAKPPQPIFAPLAGLALYNAASKVWPQLHWSLKAPNDLYIGEMKTGGLLIETIERGQERRSIVGLGLNVLTAPSSITTATSIASALGGEDKVSEDAWWNFLRTLLVNFMGSVQAGQKSELSKQDIASLTVALNRRPNLEAKIETIGPKGELYTSSGVIPWQSL